MNSNELLEMEGINRTDSSEMNGITGNTSDTAAFNSSEISSRGASKEPWWMLVHIYGFACIFFMLAFYAFISGLNIRSQISSRPFMATVNALLCGLGVSRAFMLVIEQYKEAQMLPKVLSRVLWDMGFPCLLAAFIIVQYTFLDLSQMDFGPDLFRNQSFLAVVICLHFCSVLGTDIIVSLGHNTAVVLYISQTVFCGWSLVVHLVFLYVGFKVKNMLNEIPSNSLQNGITSNTKGIMQLALLSRCSNIASSVITSSAPTRPQEPPRIHITDENELTVSFHSEAAPELGGKVAGGHTEAIASTSTASPNPSVAKYGERPPITGARTTTDKYGERPPITGARTTPDKFGERPLITGARTTTDKFGERPSTTGAKATTDKTHADTRQNIDRAASEIHVAATSSDGGRHSKHGADASRISRVTSNKPVDATGAASNTLFAQTCLKSPRGSLVCDNPVDSAPMDLTLQTVLNHIAFSSNPVTSKMSPKYQVRKVLKVTGVAAVLGVILSMLYLFHLYLPISSGSLYWYSLQTCCRAAEFLVGCCIANITKLPVQRTAGNGLLRQYH